MASPYPVELTPPDISGYAGNTDIPFVTRLDSGRPGPHVLVNAVTHGNELCGAIAVDFLFKHAIRPARGVLSLSFANVAAFQRFDARAPETSRFVDEDFNRLWDVATLDGPRQSAELARARKMRPLIDQVDYLLDLHSMQHMTPPLALCGPTRKGRELALAVEVPQTIVADTGHAAGRRMRDYGAFSDETNPKAALLVECGQHWQASSATVAIETTLRFLKHLELLDAAALAHLPTAPPPRQSVIEVTEAVTVVSDRFEFTRRFIGHEIIPVAGTVIGLDGDRPITTPYDNCVLIMPSRRLTRGQTAVRLGRIVA
ncbi:MAG TPA: succinylglutamate desuccinylase/aspartoacylase family protein [Candidatus Sulfotelmatobacter sp.]|nr:succinylglutamate desuccinylase/aspartoacylase family protein [Candidatus Sulfotelmatobacter sp.]